jgi:hypothetical protein
MPIVIDGHWWAMLLPASHKHALRTISAAFRDLEQLKLSHRLPELPVTIRRF